MGEFWAFLGSLATKKHNTESTVGLTFGVLLMFSVLFLNYPQLDIKKIYTEYGTTGFCIAIAALLLVPVFITKLLFRFPGKFIYDVIKNWDLVSVLDYNQENLFGAKCLWNYKSCEDGDVKIDTVRLLCTSKGCTGKLLKLNRGYKHYICSYCQKKYDFSDFYSKFPCVRKDIPINEGIKVEISARVCKFARNDKLDLI